LRVARHRVRTERRRCLRAIHTDTHRCYADIVYKRLNITLRDDVLARADAFAKRERYTRSGLIAAALEAFVSGRAPGAGLASESAASYMPSASASLDDLNPRVRPHVAAIAEACRRHGVLKAALVGSSTQSADGVVPTDLDVLVRFDVSLEGRAKRYFGLLAELEQIMGMPVDIIEEDAIHNPYLRDEFAATQVVLYEAA